MSRLNVVPGEYAVNEGIGMGSIRDAVKSALGSIS